MSHTLQNIDVQFLHFINYTLSNSFFDALCPLLRNKLTWIPLYAVLAFLLLKRDKKSGLIWIAIAVVTVIASDQTGLLFKNYFERIRPCNNEELLNWLAIRAKCSSSFSFVSSHAANHFAQAILYHHIFKNRNASLLFFIWALVIAFSQVYVGVHYPSDVIAGAILGLLIGFSMSKIGDKILYSFTR